jgi:hypothetical protein
LSRKLDVASIYWKQFMFCGGDQDCREETMARGMLRTVCIAQRMSISEHTTRCVEGTIGIEVKRCRIGQDTRHVGLVDFGDFEFAVPEAPSTKTALTGRVFHAGPGEIGNDRRIIQRNDADML